MKQLKISIALIFIVLIIPIVLGVRVSQPDFLLKKWAKLNIPKSFKNPRFFLNIRNTEFLNGQLLATANASHSEFISFVDKNGFVKTENQSMLLDYYDQRPVWWDLRPNTEYAYVKSANTRQPMFIQLMYWDKGKVYFRQNGPFDLGIKGLFISKYRLER